jgi:hypothetical protein
LGHGWGDLDDSLECPGINDIRDDLGQSPWDNTLLGAISFNAHAGGTKETACNYTDQQPGAFPPGLFLVGIPQGISAMDRNGDPSLFGPDGWTNDDLNQDVDGWFGGVQAGFLYQVNRIVFGLEVSGSVTNMSDTGVVEQVLPAAFTLLDNPGNQGVAVYEWKTDINAIYTSVARAGFAVLPDLLLSVKGGLAFAQIDFTSSAGYEDQNTVEGWTIGLQADLKLTKNTSAFIGWDHMEFDDVSFVGTSGFLFFHTTTYREYDYELDMFKLGMNYHF